MFFCIPLLPRVKASNWLLIGDLLNGTLRSLAHQTSQDFEIIIAASELPPNLDFRGLPVAVVKPDWMLSLATLRDPHKDKRLRRMLLGSEVRKRGGGYMMLLDADDRVSSRLVEAVNSERPLNGYIFDRGYAYDYWRQIIAPVPGAWNNPFHQACGSCAVFHFGVEDLPMHSRDATPRYFSRLRSHGKWKEIAEQEARALQNLPFPGAVYFQNTGENSHDKIDPNQASNHLKELASARINLTNEIISEFSLEDDLYAIRDRIFTNRVPLTRRLLCGLRLL